MPTYQYRCPACGSQFEEFQSMTEPPLEKCPTCGKKPERLISGGAGLLFKGSGFYITDYRSAAYKSAASGDSGSASTSSSGSKESSGGKESAAPAKPSTSGSSASTPASSPSGSTTKPSGNSGT